MRTTNNAGSVDTPALPLVRHPHARVRTFTRVRGPSLTHQSHKDICDINAIIRRYENTGTLPPGPGNPQYADVTDLQSGDLTERISKSREILDTAGRHLDQRRQEQQIDLETEINRLKAENAALQQTAAAVKDNPE